MKEARINADAKEKIAEGKRQTAYDIYERYVQSVKLSRTEEQKTKTHNTLMIFLYMIGGFIALILILLAIFYGIGSLLYGNAEQFSNFPIKMIDTIYRV